MLLFIIFSKASSGISLIEPKKGLLAALQTRISICPSCARVSSTNISSAVLSEILQGITMAFPGNPIEFISSAVASQTSAFRLEITTLAPCCAIAAAMDLPIPFDEPVIMAFLPVKSNIVYSPSNYFPFQFGNLFSANATGPSMKSSLLNNSLTAE